MSRSTDPNSLDNVERLIGLLEQLVAEPDAVASLDTDQRRRLLQAAGRLARPDTADKRRRARAFRRQDRARDKSHDQSLIAQAELKRQKTLSHFLPSAIHEQLGLAPALPRHVEDSTERLRRPRACYVCKADFVDVHELYHALCPACAALNAQKRDQTADMTGRVALVTGARIKIGYHIALKLLRAGAHVIATTRFPIDAASRFAAEPDFEAFAHRLELHGLDLRHLPSVVSFIDSVAAAHPALDVLINNAAQTVRRPPAFYQHLIEDERRGVGSLSGAARQLLQSSAAAMTTTQSPADHLAAELAVTPWRDEPASEPGAFPDGLVDGDLQQIDLRGTNSWRMTADEVPAPELLEVHLVNAMAPFLLVSRLRACMRKNCAGDRHIVNVSAMEASFSRKKKTTKHPHTNMAKAALNMLTRTSAADYAADGIHMNSVDTGWVTDEDPLHHAVRKERDYEFSPPLDAIDGAARVLDPIFMGMATGEHPYGLFWKDYRPVDW